MIQLKHQPPEGFLEEEVRDGYPISRQMKEIWAVELDLYLEFRRVCDKHGIPFSSFGGTMLGAVRHKGFIPWDDDMDIYMLREDYEELCKHADEFEYPYFFQTEYTDHGSLRGHAQLRNSQTTGILEWERAARKKINQGIFIDIFPLDVIPEDPEKAKQLAADIEGIREKLKYIYSWTDGFHERPHGIKGYLMGALFKTIDFFHPYQKLYRRFEDTCARFTGAESPYLSDWSFGSTEPMLPREGALDLVEMPFEMTTIPVPKNYDAWLRAGYGDDYMTPKQDPTYHGNVIFDTDCSYKDWFAQHPE